MTTTLKKPKLLLNNGYVKLYDKIIFAVIFVFAFLFMSHPDLWETANHSYVFLESVFSGDFFNFYEVVARHDNTYYYINGANYNIFVYILFGIWELPVFVFNKIFSLPLSETFIIYWAKILSVAFYMGCGFMVKKLCEGLGLKDNLPTLAAMLFLLNPIAFFSPMAMGQYDTLTLFFTLWAVCYYVKGDNLRFSVLIGVGMVCKFFPMLIFIPLILLTEKRLLHILKYLLISGWLYVPTTLLFLGRTGNATVFTQAMIDRVFALTTDMGFREVSLFMVVYAVIVFASYLYTPKTDKAKNALAMYFCVAVFGLLFATIVWHPQWLILLIPFMVVTTLMQANKTIWWMLDLVFCLGFFMLCFYQFPNQAGAILFDGGLIGNVFGQRVALCGNWRLIDYFLSLISYVWVLTPVCFVAPILVSMIFKLPIGEQSLADRISVGENFDKIPSKAVPYIIFAVGFVGMWFVPSLFELLNAFNII